VTPTKYHHASHRHKTVDWQHWTHLKGSKAKELTYEEVEENERKNSPEMS